MTFMSFKNVDNNVADNKQTETVRQYEHITSLSSDQDRWILNS